MNDKKNTNYKSVEIEFNNSVLYLYVYKIYVQTYFHTKALHAFVFIYETFDRKTEDLFTEVNISYLTTVFQLRNNIITKKWNFEITITRLSMTSS